MKTLIAMMFASTVAASSVSALEVNGEIGGTTDYVWRGLSQNDGNPAAQAGVGITFENGIFGNAWTSQVDGGTKGAGNDEGAEIDLTVGWAGDTGRWGYGAQVTRYIYTEQNFGTDFTELAGFGSVQLFGGEATALVGYSNDLFENGDTNVKYYYTEAGYARDTGLFGIDAFGTAGYSTFTAGDDSTGYANWRLGVGKTWGLAYGGIRGTVEYTNVNTAARSDATFGGDETVLASLKYEF